jgi:EAL domain-containing protein (putative c-di-GMP-specific phosphodiesterase class I)/ActR/RegA family two-component response regulator
MSNKSAIKILVLDDDSFMLKLLSRMLANLGFAPAITCDSGHSALSQMDHADGLPDVILLDLNMPEMDGVEFVHHLVERHYTGSLILVSGEDKRVLQTAENLVRAHRITLLGSLHKPVTPEGLAVLLGKWSPPSLNHLPRTPVCSADELRAAIANGELINYYQPKVAPANGRVVGVETLVRWRHPIDGMVLPDQFIGIAESHGLIHDLTRTVLTEAFDQARLWQKTGLVLQLAVNVSVDNLASRDFADFITGLAATTGVPPQQVVLEVAESRIMMHDLRVPLETLTRLRLKRFRLSIDDFGAGHSSLLQLRSIPFDELKIDRSFVHRASTDEAIRLKYDASLSIARQLDMEVVAVGVEDRDDWGFLRRTGCNLAQGYFIAKPMAAADLPGWIQTWQARMRNEFAAMP